MKSPCNQLFELLTRKGCIVLSRHRSSQTMEKLCALTLAQISLVHTLVGTSPREWQVIKQADDYAHQLSGFVLTPKGESTLIGWFVRVDGTESEVLPVWGEQIWLLVTLLEQGLIPQPCELNHCSWLRLRQG